MRRLYVISDLHVGGAYSGELEGLQRGFRMCTHLAQLADFVQGLAGLPPRIELVINGDFVDFLAERWPDEPQWRPFVPDEPTALAAFRQIADRDAALFNALRALLAAGHHLTLLLGNHDVELSFGALRREIEQRLGSDHAPGRLRFIYDGEAYAIGDVLIEHGNRYDGYNVVDHGGLRRLRSAQSRRAELPGEHEYRIPPGSLLVSTIMNRLKQEYPFVDLLKPETAASIPILLALAPGAAQHARAIVSLSRKAKKRAPGEDAEPRYGDDISAVPEVFGDLDAQPSSIDGSKFDSEPAFAADVASRRDALGALLQSLLPERGVAFLDAVRQASQLESSLDVQPDDEAVPFAMQPDDEAELDWRNLLRLAIKRQTSPLHERLEVLQDALQVLRRDISWDRTRESREYMASVEKRFAAGFRCVLYGHTHLAKHVDRGGKIYINTGTWADLMRVPRAAIERTAEGRAALRELCSRLESSDLEGIVEWIPTFARVTLDDDDKLISAELCDWPCPL